MTFKGEGQFLYCEENSSILYIVGTNEHSARRVRYKLELFATQSRANLSLWMSTVHWKWIIFYFSMGLMNYQQFFSSVLILWKPKGIFWTFFSSILILWKPKGIFSKLISKLEKSCLHYYNGRLLMKDFRCISFVLASDYSLPCISFRALYFIFYNSFQLFSYKAF